MKTLATAESFVIDTNAARVTLRCVGDRRNCVTVSRNRRGLTVSTGASAHRRIEDGALCRATGAPHSGVDARSIGMCRRVQLMLHLFVGRTWAGVTAPRSASIASTVTRKPSLRIHIFIKLNIACPALMITPDIMIVSFAVSFELGLELMLFTLAIIWVCMCAWLRDDDSIGLRQIEPANIRIFPCNESIEMKDSVVGLADQFCKNFLKNFRNRCSDRVSYYLIISVMNPNRWQSKVVVPPVGSAVNSFDDMKRHVTN